MDNNLITLATDFSITPGPRSIVEGPFSGEKFRDEILAPRFLAALENGGTLTVNLDGAVGYGTSFLEEAFGGLARLYGIQEVKQTIRIISNEEPYLKDDVMQYIDEANDQVK